MPDDQEWLTSEAAAARLGVKPETLYAYVSRGTVRSERVPGTRRSRFHRGDVERRAAQKQRRGGGRAGGLGRVRGRAVGLDCQPGLPHVPQRVQAGADVGVGPAAGEC